MTEEEKHKFLEGIATLWETRGDITRYVDYTPKKLRRASPEIADAMEQLQRAQKRLNTLMDELAERVMWSD